MSPERSSMDEQSRELENLLLQRKRPSPIQVWNQLSRDERSHAVRSFLDSHSEGRLKLNDLLARSLSYRPQTIRRWPEDRLVGMLSTLRIPHGAAAMDLLIHGQLAKDRPVAATLLDRLGISHRDGRVDASESLEAAESAVAEAAESVAGEYGRRAVVLCLLVYRLERAPLAGQAREWLEPAEGRGDPDPQPAPDPAGVEPRWSPLPPTVPPETPEARPGSSAAAKTEDSAPPVLPRSPRPGRGNRIAPDSGSDEKAVDPERIPTAVVTAAETTDLPHPTERGLDPAGGGAPAAPDVSEPAAGDQSERSAPAAPSEPSPAAPRIRPPEPVSPTPPAAWERYEPEGDPGADAWLTTLDRLLQNAAVDTWREISGALSQDDLDDAVEEFAALNGSRPHSQFHVGHRDALFGRSVNPATDVDDPSRQRWYWAGAITGFARREARAEIVQVFDKEPVIRGFGRGDGPAATVAVRAVVDALREKERGAELAGFVSGEAVTRSPELFEPLVEAATDLLRGAKPEPALALFAMLRKAADEMERTGEAPPPQMLFDTRRRTAHCFRVLHEHERARRLLIELLDEDDDPDKRAMMEADLGLLAGEFDGIGDVELPVRVEHLDDFVDRLSRGEERFERSSTTGAAHAAHGNYLRGVLLVGRAFRSGDDEHWRRAELHLLQARTVFRQRGRAYSDKFIARNDLYFAIARAQRLQPEGLAHAARVLAEALAGGARLPEYLVRPSLEAFTVADPEDLQRIVSAMMRVGNERALDELARSAEALKQSRTLVNAIWRRSSREDRSAAERATDLRASLRGLMAQRRHDDARKALDRLEELAGAGVGVGDFLEILEDEERCDPAWSPEEALIARARCHQSVGDFARAVQVMRRLFFQALAKGTPKALDDADGILEWLRQHCRAVRDEWRDLEDALPAGASDPGPTATEPVERIRVLVVGAGEQLARNEERVRERLKRNHPHIRVTFVRTGWSANWMPAFAEFDRGKDVHHALVLMRFVRTNFGRRVRQAWPGDRPWRFCWGEGRKLLTRTIVRAAAAAATKGD